MNEPKSELSRYYVTTAIPYVNAKPHIGFALEAVQTDVLARYQRWKGADVRFLTGTDENSLKNVRAAEQAGLPTQVLVHRYAADFYALRTALDLSFDDFIRTSSEPRHRAGVERLWRACAQRGDIYTRPYRGLYCVGCEQFYMAEELADGLCPEHLTAPELVEEQNYFFRLSRYAEQLGELIATDQLRIVPRSRKNEVLSFLRGGLSDFSISRSRARARGWGIAVPGDPDQVIYVWFDALGNYITALGYADDAPLYQRYWLENPQRVHVIGKGIIRFHAIYWPAMLLSAGVPLPTTLFVHGYVTVGGEKISKSRGTSIDPVAITERYGADALRYYLLREIPPTEDGDFTHARFARVYNADLADQLGNLLQRVLGMVGRYYAGHVPAAGQPDELDLSLIAMAQALAEQIDAALGRFAANEALAAIWNLIAAANKYVVTVQPWALAKRRAESAAIEQRLATSLYALVETLRIVAQALLPLLPGTAASIARQLGIAIDTSGDGRAALTWGRYPAGTAIQPGALLFPKLEDIAIPSEPRIENREP